MEDALSSQAPQSERQKYLWGNVPAIDILKLQQNEGESYRGDVKLCFAASGDLRNLILTINGLPRAFDSKISCVLNDVDDSVTARNVASLLLAFKLPAAESAFAILHLWYSARLPQAVVDGLASEVTLLVADVCKKIADKPETSLQSKIWQFGLGQLRVVLTKAQWLYVLHLLSQSANVAVTEARRKGVLFAPDLADHIDRRFCTLEPFARVAFTKFNVTGLLVPFGADNSEFTVPNMTLFANQCKWQQNFWADPLDSWWHQDLKTGSQSADFPPNDKYGAMAHHVEALLARFSNRLRTLPLSITVYQMNAIELPAFLPDPQFDRIEVSNITDGGWVGVEKILKLFGPLLRKKADNPSATLIGLFMNAVHEFKDKMDQISPNIGESQQTILRAATLLRGPGTGISAMTYPRAVALTNATSFFLDFDGIFNAYMQYVGFPKIAAAHGLRMKDRHSIIDKWPYRLKEPAGSPGAQEEFNVLNSSSLTGVERYAEWCRA